MSTSVPPRDANAPTQIPANSSAIPDEQALRKLFDAEFSNYIDSAKAQLGDAPGLAPRVVEMAFVNVWMQRQTLRDANQVKTFLTDEVHHGAARALSRRAAAARFGGQGGDKSDKAAHAASTAAADPAKSWGEVEKAIHGGGASGAAHAAVADSSRHDAAAHMKTVGKGRSWVVPVIGGIVVLGGLIAAGFYFDKMGEDDAILTSVGVSGMQPMIQSGPGQIGNTTLSDSSKVRLGPDTKLYEPDGFPTKIHAVRLEGTAKFDVTPVGPKELAFRVIARKTHFIATGTSFILSAFPEDSFAVLQVREGSVTVKSAKGTQIVGANQVLLVDSTGLHAPTDAQKEAAFGWVDGRIVSNKTLKDAVFTLGRWFNMDVKVPDLSLLTRPASFDVAIDSSRAAIAQIEKSANVKFGYESEAKVFRDAGGAKPSAPAAKAPVKGGKKK